MKKTRTKLIILCFLLSALCLFSLTMAWVQYAEQNADRHAFNDLAAQVSETSKPSETEPKETDSDTETEAPTEETTEPVEQQPKRNLAPIIEQNGDCIGWLCIPGTEVDYPVMHTPNDPQKYLRRNFEGKYSASGIPFLDYRCSLDSNLIIYGHNMKNGTMFSCLKQYLNEDYRQAHSVIEFETPAGLRLFTVTEVIKTNTSDDRYDRIATEDGKARLILSTCHGSSKNGRLLVIAVESTN